MTENETPTNESEDGSQQKQIREPFPFMHLLFAMGFAVIASAAYWVIVLLAVLQFLTIAVTRKKNEELQRFSHLTARYVQELFDYVTVVSDQKPFPIGAFPKD